MNDFRKRLEEVRNLKPTVGDTFDGTFKKIELMFGLAIDILDEMTKPCVYEIRPLNDRSEGPAGAWCTKHGWFCHNTGGGPDARSS